MLSTDQATNLVLQIDALAQQRLTGRQECAGVVALDALHMHRTLPPGAQDLLYPTRTIPISLVAHAGKSGLHLPGFENDRLEACCPKPIGQPLG
jgi:hypothetical protein